MLRFLVRSKRHQKAANNYCLEGGSTCRNDTTVKNGNKKNSDQQGGSTSRNKLKLLINLGPETGWVNITGMVGQHKSERWVNMVWNLQ